MEKICDMNGHFNTIIIVSLCVSPSKCILSTRKRGTRVKSDTYHTGTRYGIKTVTRHVTGTVLE